MKKIKIKKITQHIPTNHHHHQPFTDTTRKSSRHYQGQSTIDQLPKIKERTEFEESAMIKGTL